MENREYIREQFLLYLNGELTGLEAENLLQYIRSGQDREFVESLIDEFLDHPIGRQLSEDINVRQRLAQTHTRINGIIDQQEYQKVFRMRWLRLTGIAASITIIFAAGWLFRTSIRNWIDPVKMQQLTTLRGEHKQVTLSDGTQIWLSPSSRIDFPETFNRDTRDVKLSGSAFFEVAKDSAHPFTVHTGAISTKVLGTSFQVDAYRDQPDVSVTLLTGKVLLATAKDTTRLLPKQQGKVNKKTGSIQKTNYPDADDYLSRRNGVLEYHGTPAIFVIADLQREFNINIEVERDLRQHGFYGSISMKDGPLVAIQKLCATIGAGFEYRDNQFTIIPISNQGGPRMK